MLASEPYSSFVLTPTQTTAQTVAPASRTAVSRRSGMRDTASANAPAAAGASSGKMKPGHCAKTTTKAQKTAVGIRSVSSEPPPRRWRTSAYTVQTAVSAVSSQR
jgi:hypothetical protein